MIRLSTLWRSCAKLPDKLNLSAHTSTLLLCDSIPSLQQMTEHSLHNSLLPAMHEVLVSAGLYWHTECLVSATLPPSLHSHDHNLRNWYPWRRLASLQSKLTPRVKDLELSLSWTLAIALLLSKHAILLFSCIPPIHECAFNLEESPLFGLGCQKSS